MLADPIDAEYTSDAANHKKSKCHGFLVLKNRKQMMVCALIYATFVVLVLYFASFVFILPQDIESNLAIVSSQISIAQVSIIDNDQGLKQSEFYDSNGKSSLKNLENYNGSSSVFISIGVSLPSNTEAFNDYVLDFSEGRLENTPGNQTFVIIRPLKRRNQLKYQSGSVTTIEFEIYIDSIDPVTRELLNESKFCSKEFFGLVARIKLCVTTRLGIFPYICPPEISVNLSNLICDTRPDCRQVDQNRRSRRTLATTNIFDQISDSFRFFGLEVKSDLSLVLANDLGNIFQEKNSLSLSLSSALRLIAYVSLTSEFNSNTQIPLLDLSMNETSNIYTQYDVVSPNMMTTYAKINTTLANRWEFLELSNSFYVHLKMFAGSKTNPDGIKAISFQIPRSKPILSNFIIDAPTSFESSSTTTTTTTTTPTNTPSPTVEEPGGTCKKGINRFLPALSVKGASFVGNTFTFTGKLISDDFECQNPANALAFLRSPLPLSIMLAMEKNSSQRFANLSVSVTQNFDDVSRWPRSLALDYNLRMDLIVTDVTLLNEGLLTALLSDERNDTSIFALISNLNDISSDIWAGLTITSKMKRYLKNELLQFLFVKSEYQSLIPILPFGTSSKYQLLIQLPDFIKGALPSIVLGPFSFNIAIPSMRQGSYVGALFSISLSTATGDIDLTMNFNTEHNLIDSADFKRMFHAVIQGLNSSTSEHVATVTTIGPGVTPTFQVTIPRDPRVLYCFFQTPTFVENQECVRGIVQCTNNFPFPVQVSNVFNSSLCTSGTSTAPSPLNLGPAISQAFLGGEITVSCPNDTNAFNNRISYPRFLYHVCGTHQVSFGNEQLELVLFRSNPEPNHVEPTSSPTQSDDYVDIESFPLCKPNKVSSSGVKLNSLVKGAKAGFGILILAILGIGVFITIRTLRHHRKMKTQEWIPVPENTTNPSL